MRKLKPYKGKELPADQMTRQQLKAYIKWGNNYLEWCVDEDGRVNAYDRMCIRLSVYIEELEKREIK